jgi:3-phosphoshikimate 1-carboxyvinyltransferase
MRFVTPSALSGEVNAPPSKSIMQRAVAAATLARGESAISHPSDCDDAEAALGIAEALGASVVREPGCVRIAGELRVLHDQLDCRESGLCLRLFASIAALTEARVTLTAHGTLPSRPIGFVQEPLESLGVRCETTGGQPPLVIQGPLRNGRVEVDASVSSQFLSGLLMALPCCAGPSVVEVTRLASASYVGLTLQVVAAFGVCIDADPSLCHFRIQGSQRYRPSQIAVEGDWSGAAMLAVAGAIAGEVHVRGLAPASLQPDRAVVEILRRAGAELAIGPDGLGVRKARLGAWEADLADAPDLFPPLAVLACYCEGRSVLRGASRLRAKESDRASAITEALRSMGALISVAGDEMTIDGGPLHGATIDPRGDHRIAMACAVAALRAREAVRIEHDNCVNKSYPGFFDALQSLGAKLA